MQSSYDIHTARLKDAIRTEEVAHRKKRSQEKVRHRAEIDAKNDELRKMGEQARALASGKIKQEVAGASCRIKHIKLHPVN